MRKTRRRKRSLARIKWFFGVVAAAIVIFFAINFQNVNKNEFDKSDNLRFIMLLGVDKREDDTGRSDTLMVACVDKTGRKASLLSVPRDTRVAIAGHGYDKINHAFAYGGEQLTEKCVEELLGVKIDNYIMIDTHAFERIIDAVGGVDINVEKRMYYEDPWDDNGGLVIDLYPGEQHLDGATAEQYVRYRDGEGDIGRINRQQKFMSALLTQAVNPAIITRLPDILDKVKDTVQTDMTPAELAEFAHEVKSWHDNGLNAVTLPGKPAYFEDISYWLPDIVALRMGIAEKSGITDTEQFKKAAMLAAAKYEQDLPRALKETGDKSNADKANDKGSTPGEKETAKTEEQNVPPEEKSAEGTEKKPVPAEKISVMVINSSGINGAGAQVADILQRKGFIISGVETGKTDSRENTTITTAAENTDIFYGMPFACIILDGGDENQAVVNIGRDYEKQGE